MATPEPATWAETLTDFAGLGELALAARTEEDQSPPDRLEFASTISPAHRRWPLLLRPRATVCRKPLPLQSRSEANRDVGALLIGCADFQGL